VTGDAGAELLEESEFWNPGAEGIVREMGVTGVPFSAKRLERLDC